MKEFLIKSIFKYFSSISREKALKRANQIGNLLWKVGYRKDVIFKNLDIAFPEKDKNWKENIARLSLINISRVLIEFPRQPQYVKSGYIKEIFKITKGLDIAKEYKKDGFIFVTAHIGNWELGGAGLSAYLENIWDLAYRQSDEKINKIITDIRTNSGINIIFHDQSMKAFINLLQEKKVITFFVDQNALAHRGNFVDFFGIKASTVNFPAKLAIKYKKPVLFAYDYFDEEEKIYKCEIEEVSYEITENFEEDVLNLTQAYTKKVEEAVKKHPDQYLWTHKRWNTRPEGEEKIY